MKANRLLVILLLTFVSLGLVAMSLSAARAASKVEPPQAVSQPSSGPVAPQAVELSGFKSAPIIAETGSVISTLIEVDNLGALTATNISLIDGLPPGTVFISGSLDCSLGVCSFNLARKEITWQGQLGLLESVSVGYLLSVTNQACGQLINTALISETNMAKALELRSLTRVVPQVYAQWDLEAESGGFSPQGDWQWGVPAANFTPGPQAAFQGAHAWGTNLSGPYGAGVSTLSRALDLSGITAGPSGLWLSWWQWFDLTGSSLNGPDRGRVLVNGVPVAEVFGSSGGIWQPQRINLSAFARQVVTVSFQLAAAPGSSFGPGWYLDSLALEAGCPFIGMTPDQEGAACQGASQSYVLSLYNGTFAPQSLSYNLSGNLWPTSPRSLPLSLQPGEFFTLPVTVNIPYYAPNFATDFATAMSSSAANPGLASTARLSTHAGPHWQLENPAPRPAWDNALIHYQASTYYFPGAITETYRYNGFDGKWTRLADQPGPAYASTDACLGFDAAANPVILLFPDGFVGGSLHRYNILQDQWDTLPPPSVFPPQGLRGIDIVSDLAANRCYISGGAGSSTPAADSFFEYNPATNEMVQLPPMLTARYQHASWAYNGKICVAGGLDNTNAVLSSTQCFNPQTGQWSAENADLAPLPYAVWGMADAEKDVNGFRQLWIMGGSRFSLSGGSTAPTQETAYWDTASSAWKADAPLRVPVYRTEGDLQNGELIVVSGYSNLQIGNSNYQFIVTDNQRHIQCNLPANLVDLAIEKTAAPESTSVGNIITYTLRIANQGQELAAGVVMTDYLPAKTAYISATLDQGTCTHSSQVVSCTLGSLFPGEAHTATIHVQALAKGDLINYARVDSRQPDAFPVNNSDSTLTVVSAKPLKGPKLSKVQPDSGVNTAPVTVTVLGARFEPGLSLWLGATPLTQSQFINSSKLLVLIPGGVAPGTYPLRVINPDGLHDVLLSAYTALNPSPPAIRKVLPPSGPNTIPIQVDVLGSNFAPGIQIGIRPSQPPGAVIPLRAVIHLNDQHIRAIVPPNLPSGIYDLVVQNPDGLTGTLLSSYRITAAEELDLLSDPVSLWMKPLTVRAGQTAVVGLRVQQQGGFAPQAFVPVTFLTETLVSQFQAGAGNQPLQPAALVTATLSWPQAGAFTLYGLIDPQGLISETQEDNNVISRTVRVLPPSTDELPPQIISFTINQDALNTDTPQISLDLTAKDLPGGSGVVGVIYIEYEYSRNIDTWVAVQNSGWLPYAASHNSYPWLLSPSSGVHFVRAWVVDQAGNISPLPQRKFINYIPAQAELAPSQVDLYWVFLKAGDQLLIHMSAIAGDPDLLVWSPDGSKISSLTSETGAPVEEVELVAAQEGIYQIEVEGFGDAQYSLELIPDGVAATWSGSLYPVYNRPVKGRDQPLLNSTLGPPENTGLPDYAPTYRIYFSVMAR